MADEICCVCGLPIEGEVFSLRGRTYDSTHYSRIARENRAAAWPIFLTIAILVIFAVVVSFLSGPLSRSVQGAGLIVVETFLAVVPTLIWLYAFYRQDRLEPEPKRYVFGVLALAGLLAAAVGQPVIRNLFQVQDWFTSSRMTAILVSIFIVGFTQEFLKYAAVRYSIFYSAEFDERVDGIIYGAAAGLGYAPC